MTSCRSEWLFNWGLYRLCDFDLHLVTRMLLQLCKYEWIVSFIMLPCLLGVKDDLILFGTCLIIIGYYKLFECRSLRIIPYPLCLLLEWYLSLKKLADTLNEYIHIYRSLKGYPFARLNGGGLTTGCHQFNFYVNRLGG
jgi:hypothetical protein